MSVKFDDVQSGDVLVKDDGRYLVMVKRDLIVMGGYPRGDNLRTYDQSEFDAAEFSKE